MKHRVLRCLEQGFRVEGILPELVIIVNVAKPLISLSLSPHLYNGDGIRLQACRLGKSL